LSGDSPSRGDGICSGSGPRGGPSSGDGPRGGALGGGSNGGGGGGGDGFQFYCMYIEYTLSLFPLSLASSLSSV
jgi:hypothetical protein